MRYITVKGFIHNNELIPIWDSRVIYQNHEMYGEIFKLKDVYQNQELTDLIFDTKEKVLKLGNEIDYYVKPEFSKGEAIYHEGKRMARRELKESQVVDIKYETYEVHNMSGKQLLENSYYYEGQDIKIDEKSIYSIKQWEPTYIMENGFKTKYVHQIYRKAKV